MLNKLSESQLIKVWQNQLLGKMELATEDGETINIIYPGRPNDEQGADFRDVVIATSRGLSKGDVELHIKSSDWRSHRHHQNPVYNRVILHVVMWNNAGTATRLQNGREVSILALNKYLEIPDNWRADLLSCSTTSRVPCLNIAQRQDEQTIAGLLSRAGEERFLDKAGRFRRDLVQMEASQSLYQGIMEALGYSKNKLPFLELARRLPIHILESIGKRATSDRECLIQHQALLLGIAGLLPTQYQKIYRRNGINDRWLEKLVQLWASLPYTKTMSFSDWNLFKVRPNNSPVRRLVAMSYLLLRYREKGLLKGLVHLIEDVPENGGYRNLEEGLHVTIGGYQASYPDLFSSDGEGSLTLLGSGRSADIAVNVLLPFSFAWGQFSSQPELSKKAMDIYHLYPRLAVNSVEKHMSEQLGLSCGMVKLAKCQQGLIHIYKKMCTQGKCHKCDLSQLEAGNYIQV
jgi:hypothetical protein